MDELDEYVVARIVDVVVAVAVAIIVVILFEPLLRRSSLVAEAAIQALVKRL